MIFSLYRFVLGVGYSFPITAYIQPNMVIKTDISTPVYLESTYVMLLFCIFSILCDHERKIKTHYRDARNAT